MPLSLSVDYYNPEEEKLFQSYNNYHQINQMIGGNFTISEDEFKAYMLFTEQADQTGWNTYNDLQARVEHRLGDIDDFLDFSGGTITTKISSERMNAAGMTERIGVSLGLNVVNKFHGLTEADWAITANSYNGGKRDKDFDYEIQMASDGQRFIQVENKGTICEDNQKKCSSVSNHYRSIKDKKESILEREKVQNIQHHNIYYGTIGVLDDHNTAKVWLVDPEPSALSWDPKKYKLLSRLIFYSRVFAEIGIQKNIQVALRERIEQLKESDNYESFNNKPLKSKGKNIKPFIFIQAKNVVSVNYNEAFGTFFFIKNKNETKVFVVAIPKPLINLILQQKFEGILDYEYNNDEINERVSIGLSARSTSASSEFNDSNIEFVLDEQKKRYYYQSYQRIGHDNSGRIFGIIKTHTNSHNGKTSNDTNISAGR